MIFSLLFVALLTACGYSPRTLIITGNVIAVTQGRDYTKIEIQTTKVVRNYDGKHYQSLENMDFEFWFPGTVSTEDVLVGNEIVLNCLDTGNKIQAVDHKSCDVSEE